MTKVGGFEQVANEQLVFWLRLLRDQNWSRKQKHHLLSYYKTPQRLFAASYHELLELSKQSYCVGKAADKSQLNDDLAWLEQPSHDLITMMDERYPSLLHHIADPPLALFVKGDLELLNEYKVAIVGSRRPTPVGQKITKKFSTELSTLGIAVTSGMALGIDGCAHQSALDNHSPTIAVMGCGLDVVYPARHRRLFQQIAEHGVLVSEYPLGTPPKSHHFPQRNRIVSGLSYGVIIVEAAYNSGTMITARLAMEQNREVFVVPGSILNSQYDGSHSLIRDGATLVRTVDDVLQEMKVSFKQSDKNDSKLLTEPKQTLINNKVLDFVGYEPTLINDIILASGLTAAQVSSMLLLLEVEGLVASTDEGGYIKLA